VTVPRCGHVSQVDQELVECRLAVLDRGRPSFVGGMALVVRCRLCLASSNWPLVETLKGPWGLT
jgi:hypothetical protein